MSQEEYKKISPVVLDPEKWVIPFNLSLLANPQEGISSAKIPFPFKVTGLGLTCPPDRNMLNLYYFLIGTSSSVSTSSISEGVPLYNALGATSYLRGDNCFYRMELNRKSGANERYVKFHVVNGYAYLQQFFGFIEIEQIGEYD